MLLSKMPGNIKEAIGNGKVEKALSLLEDYLKAAKPALLDDALLVKSKYFKAKEDFELRSISSREEFERTNAQTIMGIQELLKKAEQNVPSYGAAPRSAAVSPSSSRRWIFIAAMGIVLGIASVFVIKKLNKEPATTEPSTIYYFEDSNPFKKKGKISEGKKEEKLVNAEELSRDEYWEVILKVPDEYINAPVFYKNNQPAIVVKRVVDKITIAVPKKFKVATIQLSEGSEALIKETKITRDSMELTF
jgi:hypothetical protein